MSVWTRLSELEEGLNQAMAALKRERDSRHEDYRLMSERMAQLEKRVTLLEIRKDRST